MKKLILMTVALFFFAAFIPTYSHSSNITHKVRSGDNLYNLAKRYHVSVDQLKSMNNLRSTKLSLGQVLIVKTDTSDVSPNTKAAKKKAAKKKKTEEVAVTENDGEFIEYKVKKGDTLDRIATRFEVDREDIAEANDLQNSLNKRLKPGRVLLIPRNTENESNDEEYVTLVQKSLQPWKNSEEKYMLVKVAKSFMGAPYRYGGESVRGLDCSAYVKKIYEIFDVELPRSAREQFRVGAKVSSKEDLSVGDLVFFKTKRYAKYPTHVGIYIGDGNFIHSSSYHSKLGVKVDSLDSSYYARTFIGATRVKRPTEENPETTNATYKNTNKS
ncbi:MAG: D-gamma-glutamyl-meso-diaminopimelic acid endopeptidase CwlS precursor [Syntrophorhabdus sp. PtaU1.Bin058]|nr:MAG: D-gamma-glutamyl-meso-diaminopimelic acid endopeptidase CwlS precursor [Syntrophorhabdus sp. PtaU1.Bin058]